jgi:FG-GAP repeat
MNTNGTHTAVLLNRHTINGPSLVVNDEYGISLTNMGDLDGDGITDIAVAAM